MNLSTFTNTYFWATQAVENFFDAYVEIEDRIKKKIALSKGEQIFMP